MEMWRCVVFVIFALSHVRAENTYMLSLPSTIRPGLDLKVLVNIIRSQGDVTVTTALWKTQGQLIDPEGPVPLPVPQIALPQVAAPQVAGPQISAPQISAPFPGEPGPKPGPAPIPSAPTEEKVVETRTVVSAGNPVTVSMVLPDNLTEGTYFLVVTGSGGLTFENRGELRFSRNSLAVFVQTDKGIYKPGQKVMFRVFAVHPDMKPFTGNFDINIFDSSNNRIKQYDDVRDGEAIFSGELMLSDQPVMGSWRIEATAKGQTETVFFRVDQFVLPKFEVTVDVPEFGFTDEEALTGSLEAKYTFGELVEGKALLRLRKNFFFPRRGRPCEQPMLEKRLMVNGKTTFSVTAEELRSLDPECAGEPPRPGTADLPPLWFLRGKILVVEADVTETLTGNTLSGSDQIQYSDNRFQLTWLPSNPRNFKPGLWYDAFLKVTNMDGTLIPVTQTPQIVTLEVVASFNDGCGAQDSRPNANRTAVRADQKLTPVNATLPQNGIIYWSDIVPVGSESVRFTARFPGAQEASLYLEKMDSPSNNYIQLFMLEPVIKVGSSVDIEILSTAPIQKFFYQVISRGDVVRTVELDGRNRTGFFENMFITNRMAPTAKVVAHMVLPSGEVLADSISFSVDGIYENDVSVSISHSRAEPGQNVTVTVKGDPNSFVNLMAVDQSILLLTKGNDIRQERVERKIASFGDGSLLTPPVFGAFRFPVPFSGGDVTSIFYNAGVLVISDVSLHMKRNCRFVSITRQRLVPAAVNAPVAESTPVNDQLVDPDRIRTLFPDTWLWTTKTTGNNGEAVFTATIPDTITSWVASAFAMNSVTGLGVAPTNPKVEAFMPFFVSLNLPKSVVRGEELVLQAIVFNFLSQDTTVEVTLSRSNDYFNVALDSTGQVISTSANKVERIQVQAGDAKSVFFPIIPRALGYIDIAVTARSPVAADGVVRRLLVEPEGVTQMYNLPLLIDLSQAGSRFDQSLSIPLPENIVPGSVRVKANVLGDLLGPTINNLDQLLQMPSGCGEQNMVSFAPDVFIMKYLTETSQLTNEIRDKATRFLEQGYQRELTYQRTDGSFSAFGNSDEAGSMWLTAFVVKSFCEAKPFTFIDDNVLNRAIDFMVRNQAPSGAFPETGNVIHTEMQGGAASGTALTAYVLIAISQKGALATSSDKVDARNSAISRARSFLETESSRISDVYALSIVSYALTLSSSRVAGRSFSRLQSLATEENGEKFWSVPSRETISPGGPVQPRPGLFFTPPIIIRSFDVEATAYALLNIAEGGNTTDGLPVIKWLAQRRNANGGYASTQDTVVALQSLSEFARLIYSPNSNVNVLVTAPSFRETFSVTRSSSLVLQSADIPGPPSSVSVSATGSGIAVVDVFVTYNVFRDTQEKAFDLRVTLRNETINGFQIETCVRYTRNTKSGMVVQEIGIPSGFQADEESIGKMPVLKRTESLDRKVVLYFDRVASEPVCVTMRVNRVGLVSKSQAAAVRVIQYYSPEEQVTEFYQSGLLKNSSFCDICADCDCPARTR